jgi:hypothetical protein
MATSSIPTGLWFDTTTNKDLLKTGIRSYFDNTDVNALVEWPKVFKASKVDLYEVRDARFAGLGDMSKTGDGEPAVLETPVMGTVKNYTQVKYTNGFRVTDMMQKYNKFDAVKRWTRNLKKTMLEGKDVEVFKLYNNAATATPAASNAGFDTLALASAAHTCLYNVATTYSNYLNADLTTAGYESAMKYFDSGIKNDRGGIYVAKAKTLMVNPAFRVKAYQITGADKKPFEQSNTNYKVDSYYETSVAPFVAHRLTSSTSWFLLGDVNDEQFGPTVFTGLEPDLKTEDTFDRTGDIACYSAQHFTYGFGTPELVYCGDL